MFWFILFLNPLLLLIFRYLVSYSVVFIVRSLCLLMHRAMLCGGFSMLVFVWSIYISRYHSIIVNIRVIGKTSLAN